ncbi:MAG: S-layer homology domain-containing protein [bacterium]
MKNLIALTPLLICILYATINASSDNLFQTLINKTSLTENPLSKDQEKHLKTQQITPKSLYEIPKKYKDSLQLYTTPIPILTLKDKLIIKGKNKYKTNIIINNQNIPCNNNGNFYVEYPLKETKTHHIPIIFFTPENKYILVYRTVKKLDSPKDINEFKSNRKYYINFYNSIFAKHNKDTLKTKVTRAQLAYFLCTLTKTKLIKESSHHPDVPLSHWATDYINTAMQKKWISTFPDKRFQPDKGITKIDFILSMLKANNVEIKTPPKKHQHWTTPYFKAAINEKFISQNHQSHPFEELTWATLIECVSHYPKIQSELNNIQINKLEETHEIKLDLKKIITERLEKNFNQQEHPEIYLNNFKEPKIVYNENFTLEGQINPPTKLLINNESIPIDHYGFFSKDLTLKKGKNIFILKIKNEDKALHIHYLESPKDLEGHWIQDTVAKANYAGLIKNEETFNPKNLVNREDLASLLNNIFDLKVSANISLINIPDVHQNKKKYAIQTILTNKIMNLDENGHFQPKKNLTRAQALSAIIRASKLTEQSDIEKIPFWDIQDTHWVFPYIKTAITNDILSTKYSYFYPNRLINKAEIMALLSKIPEIENKLNKKFNAP